VSIAVLAVGLGATLAAFPAESVSVVTRLAAVFGLGCAIVGLAGALLVLIGSFEPVPLVLLLVATTVGSYVVGLRRSGLREHLVALREEVLTAGPFLWIGVGVLALVAIAWAGVPILPLHGALRYWADGLELADLGGVPELTAQWGNELEPAISKLGANAFAGALSFVFLEQPFSGLAAALWLSVVGYAAGLLALGRELGLLRTAPMLPLLALTTLELPGDIAVNAGRAAGKLTFYQHEDLGRMLAAVGAAVILARSERAPYSRLAVGGILLGTAAVSHLIPVLAFGSLIGGVAVARFATGPARAHTAVVAGGASALAAVIAVGSLALARGDVGWQGAGRPSDYVLVDGRFDPTAAVNGLRQPPRPKSESRWYEPPGVITRAAGQAAVGRDVGRTGLVVLALLTACVAAVVFLFGSKELRLLAIGALAMGAFMFGVALLFSYRYSFYVQGTFGERRLFEYMPIPVFLLVLALLEVVASRLAARWRLAGGALAAAALVAVVIVSTGDLGVAQSNIPGPTRYLRAAVTTPCDSRLLVDRLTRGSFQALTGRISLTEGLAPFLRPAIVNDVLDVRRDAAAFFDDPEETSGILTEREVDYVIAEGPRALRNVPGLRLVGDFDGIEVYEVEDRSEKRALPRPDTSPGYHCFRDDPY
jgi:hypothetical protein